MGRNESAAHDPHVTARAATHRRPNFAFSDLGQEMNIAAPAATPDAPLVIVFTFDASIVPGGDPNALVIVKDNGPDPVSACIGSPGQAAPETCVESRVLLDDDDVEITVITSTASDDARAQKRDARRSGRALVAVARG